MVGCACPVSCCCALLTLCFASARLFVMNHDCDVRAPKQVVHTNVSNQRSLQGVFWPRGVGRFDWTRWATCCSTISCYAAVAMHSTYHKAKDSQHNAKKPYRTLSVLVLLWLHACMHAWAHMIPSTPMLVHVLSVPE